MSIENSTHTPIAPTATAKTMRMVNTRARSLQTRNNQDPSGQVDANDPRWVFAMRARLSIEYQLVDDNTTERLIEQARAIGLNPMQARAIIGIIEDATRRGGIDALAREEIMRVPQVNDSNSEELSNRARWLTFGVLFAWALLIAGIMQVAV